MIHLRVLLLSLSLLLGTGCETAVSVAQADSVASTEQAKPQWYKGNLHTHSLWSDGDDFPERIAAWYRDNGYHFLAISDHNIVQTGDKWVRSADLKKKGAAKALEAYLRDFADLAKTRGDTAGENFEIRLTPFPEYQPKLERAGQFLLIQSEEISDRFENKPIHINATNITGEPIKPQSGKSVVEAIRNNFRAVEVQAKQLNRIIIPHLNHPNFRWGVTAEEIAEVVEDRFFEVFNGHPQVNQEGDETHPSIDKLWDIANTLRLTTYKSAPLMGVGTDDSHHYHFTGMNRSTTGRGWIQVRAASLSVDALLTAMNKGDFYASSGVTLQDVTFNRSTKTLKLAIAPDGGAKFTTRFVGTLAPEAGQPVPADAIGVTFKSVEGLEASYQLTGRELYVRAVVISDQDPVNPSYQGQKRQAWTQPVGWESRLQQ